MILNEANVDLAFQGFKAIYTDAYTNAPAHYSKVAMTVTSGNRQETYGWLGQFPQLREWLDGERVIKDLEAHSFTILNRKFESTVDIRREDFEDDRLGLFKPMFAEMGHLARQHPDELIFGLLKDGFTTPCFDGQNYFDTEHQAPDAEGTIGPVSNMADGTEPPWFLLDTSRAVRPLIWQARVDYTFDMVNRPSDERVFMTDKYLYGVRAGECRVRALADGLCQQGAAQPGELFQCARRDDGVARRQGPDPRDHADDTGGSAPPGTPGAHGPEHRNQRWRRLEPVEEHR